MPLGLRGASQLETVSGGIRPSLRYNAVKSPEADMARAPARLHAAGDLLAAARDRFLAAEPVDPRAVREPILASWRRSQLSKVAADNLDPNFLRAPDLEGVLARSAAPVLRHLYQQLDGQPISIVLTDATGMILVRLTGDPGLERQLDK